jgi:uncharacterized OB-fold protein
VGIRDFVKNERTRWKCEKCGSTICVHRDFCLKCGAKSDRAARLLSNPLTATGPP